MPWSLAGGEPAALDNSRPASMAPTPIDDAMPPRRSRRATLALVASFVLTAAMAIVGHLDRMGNTPSGVDRPGLDAPASDLDPAPHQAPHQVPQLATVTVGVSAGLAVGIDVGSARLEDTGDATGRDARRTTTGSTHGNPGPVTLDDPVAGVVVTGREASPAGEDINVHLVAPVAWKQALAPGSAFQFHVDQTGRHLQGRVLSLDENDDPARRTVRVVGALVDDDSGLQPGMSGSARFEQRASPARR